MRVAPPILSICLVLCVSYRVSAQQGAPTVQRDPQALSIVQATLGAMGSAQALALQDSIAVGQAETFKPDGTSAKSPIVKKSKGTRMARTELQRPEGTRIRVVNGGVGVTLNPDGKVRRLFTNNTIAERVSHIPALSILADWQSSSIEVRYIGTDTVNASAVQVIAINLVPTSNPDWIDFYRSTTQTIFYVEQTTSLVTKIQYQNFAERDSNVSEKIEVFFTDYRSVNGVLVPFKQSSYADGQLRSTLTFTNVAFNSGLLDSEFVLPGVN